MVRPLVAGRPHAAALLGWGSDVLGYDDERSTDHGWGPRLELFVDAADVPAVREAIDGGLPGTFRGWPVRFGWDDVPVGHHVTVTTLRTWLVEHLGVDASAGMALADWLVTPQQRLLGVVAGPVHTDDRGELAAVRRALAWYPDQLWRWLLACQWRRLAQEEAFVQRTAEVGDEIGSAVVAARQVREIMRLALLLARRYAPYTKWLGTAFARLDDPDGLGDALREGALDRGYVAIARRHNASGLTEPVDPALRPYHARPAQVLMADRFADACLATVTDPVLRALPLVGGIDQLVDSTDALSAPAVYRRLAGAWPGAQTDSANS